MTILKIMSFKPNEFFFGLVDFIAILLPGSLLTGILLAVDATHPGWYDSTGASRIPLNQFILDNTIGPIFWVSYAFVSFGLGYFLSSTASFLDILFDKIRKQIYPYKENLLEQTKQSQYKTIRKGNATQEEKKKMLPKLEEEEVNEEEDIEKDYVKFCDSFMRNPFRRITHFFFEFEVDLRIDQSLDAAKSLMYQHLKHAASSTNTYKWCLVILDTYYPGFAEQVNKTMAASKFFRSLVVVFFLMLVFQLLQLLPHSFPWWPGGVFLLLSFREYVVQRHKSIQAAYRGVITLFYLPSQLKGSKE